MNEVLPVHVAFPFPRRLAVVVDDHPMVARGMADYLGSHCLFERRLVAASGDDCRSLIVSGASPDLLVVDFWLPDGVAASLIDELRTRCTTARLLVVSGDESPLLREKVREAGAHGFLNKNAAPEAFARAVDALMAGGEWFEVASGAPGPPYAAPYVDPQDFGLTARQTEVLGKLLRGLPNKRIARDLDVSEPTVKEHVSSILAKFGVSNRVELIASLHGRQIRQVDVSGD